MQLPFSAVDEQDVRDQPVLLLHSGVTALNRLTHGGIVIARFDPLDVEQAILGLDGSLGAEDDAGGYRRFATGVADVEALDARGRLV